MIMRANGDQIIAWHSYISMHQMTDMWQQQAQRFVPATTSSQAAHSLTENIYVSKTERQTSTQAVRQTLADGDKGV